MGSAAASLFPRAGAAQIQLTEQGLNSRDYSEAAQLEQAAGLAYAWKKIHPLKTITAFQYHVWADNRGKGGLRLGLRKFSDDPQDPFGKKQQLDGLPGARYQSGVWPHRVCQVDNRHQGLERDHSPRRHQIDVDAGISMTMDSSEFAPPASGAVAEIPAPVPTREAAFAVVAGFLGWTLDAFDFFLVVVSLPTIAAEFQVPKSAVAVSITLTLMFRPVGALIFGLLADRYGRRIPMMANLVFYSAVEVATGFAPNLTTFLVLRALFGIGMGGEWGVGASLVMEKVPPKWRGVLSGFLQEGYAFGFFLAAVAGYYMLEPWGWRSMFFLGGAPALLAVFIRFFH